jgi:hypothetical protein
MDQESVYSREQIEEICEEVNRWRSVRILQAPCSGSMISATSAGTKSGRRDNSPRHRGSRGHTRGR